MSDVTGPVDTSKAADRTRAYRIRAKVKQQQEVSPEEAAWLSDYEAAQSKGASASRRVSYTEEEHAAVGTGSAAEVAASAALAREEGRRIDYLASTGIRAMEAAFGMLHKVSELMMGRMQQMEDVHLGMLDAVRTHYLERTKAEAEAIRKEAEEGQQGGMEQMAMAMLLQRLGVPVAPVSPQLPTSAPKHRTKTPPKRAK